MIVEALISYKKEDISQGELACVVEQLQNLFFSMNKQSIDQSSDGSLPNTFLNALRQSVKQGVRVE